MTDYVKDLISLIKDKYTSINESDESLAKLLEQCKGSQTYEDAYEYAKKAGFNLEKAIIDNWDKSQDVYFGTMADLLKGSAENLVDDINAACEFVQTNKNIANNINLKPQIASVNEDDLRAIADKMTGKAIDDIEGRLATYGCKVVDDNQLENIKFQTGSGFDVIVSRVYDGVGLRKRTKYAERCLYCLSRSGSKVFKTISQASNSGIFGRHPGCGCTIDYECKSTGTRTKNVQNYNTGIKEKVKLQASAEKVFNNISESPVVYSTVNQKIYDVTKEYKKEARPFAKQIDVSNGDTPENVATAKWIDKEFGWGGKLIEVEKQNGQNLPTPDAFIKGQYWEFKDCSSKNSIDKRMQHASDQILAMQTRHGIENQKGVMVIDITKKTISSSEMLEYIAQRMPNRCKTSTDIIVKDNNELVKVLRIKK